MVNVEIVYLPINATWVHLKLALPKGTTVAEALVASELLETYPEINGLTFGIFSQQVKAECILKSGDRLEIYRPLLCDPKENRRKRARNA